MIELGSGVGASAVKAGAGGLVFDVGDAEFAEKVLEASRARPVIVDFWAPWCGPCKQLGPVLEQAVAAAGGKVALAKVNIDENPVVAGQLRVQSIPMVFAFVDGQPVDGFSGALSPSQAKAFVDKIARTPTAAGGEGQPTAEQVIEVAEAALAEGAAAEALQAFGAALQLDPTALRAIGGVARCYVASGDLVRARQFLDSAPADKQSDPAIVSARAMIDLAEETAASTASLTRNQAKLQADQNDHQARYDVAMALVAANDRSGAVNELLEIFRRDRNWRDEAAKTQLMKLFDAFGPTDPATLAGRRKLSSLIFA